MFAYCKNGFASVSRLVKVSRVPGLLCGCCLLAAPAGLSAETNRLASSPGGKVYIVPIRENIMPPLVYVVRRGVKEAMEAKADALILGMIGLYIEFKTPGFGLPGIVGIVAFALYFFGGYTAGLSGVGWAVVFLVGLILVALELFVFPGTLIAGIGGVVLMLVAIVMGMVDAYPHPGPPRLPTLPQLQLPLRDLGLALAGTTIAALVLARFLPKTSFFQRLVSQTASGVSSVAAQEAQQEARVGQVGVALSPLCPGGKARFGDQILDVLTQSEMIGQGRPVKIIGRTGSDAVVEEAS